MRIEWHQTPHYLLKDTNIGDSLVGNKWRHTSSNCWDTTDSIQWRQEVSSCSGFSLKDEAMVVTVTTIYLYLVQVILFDANKLFNFVSFRVLPQNQSFWKIGLFCPTFYSAIPIYTLQQGI